MLAAVYDLSPDALAAERTAESVNNILSVMRGLAGADGPRDARDAAMRNLLSSTRVTQHAERAVLTASATVEQAQVLANGDTTPATDASARGALPSSAQIR